MRRLLAPAVAVVAAGLAVRLGRPWLAAAVLAFGVLALQPVLLTPPRPGPSAPRRAARATSRGLVRLLRRLGRLTVTVVTAVAGAFAFYLVLTPAGLVARLFGAHLLPSGEWHALPAARRATPDRAFVGSRGGRGAAPATGRGVSWRAAVALVAVGAIAATLVPRVVDRRPDDSTAPEQLRGRTFNAFDSPALDDADWKGDAGVEFAEASGGQTYTSYVGSSLRDYEGRYVNIAGRERRSYHPAEASGGEPIDVWFFGGSTMFGFSAQRDLHTIPSEVVRLAEDDGVTIHAHNFGAPGYVNMQETILATQLLAAGRRPDLIVFYDGINDLAVLFQQAFGGIGVPGDPTDISAYAYRRYLAGQLTGTDQPPVPVAPVPDLGRPPQAEAVISALVDVYGRGIELASGLGDQYEIPVVHFWQPDLFNKDELAAGEDVVVERLGMDQFQYDTVARISRAVIAQLPEAAIELSDAFDGVEEPVLTDQAHTNELGARLVAEAMYTHLGATLDSLAGDAT